MRFIKLIIISVFIFLVLFAIYTNIPKNMRYEIEDSFERITAPDFNVPFNKISARNQTDIVSEFTNQGYNLKCYGNLQVEEKIGEYNDYVCWAVIKSLYSKIPAKRITLYFYQKKLAHVRLEFPESSFEKLHDNLSRQLNDKTRLDALPIFNFKKDKFGNKLKVWKVRGGIVTTSSSKTPNQYNIVLWTAGHILLKSAINRKISRSN